MMASKSKQARMRQAKKKEPAAIAVLIAFMAATIALLQNKYGHFSDIRGFYGLHFADGLHHWPFSTHTLQGATESIHPVEYPAITGFIMWIFSFFVKPSQMAVFDYFRLTAVFHVALFGMTTYLVKKIAGSRWAIIFAVSPAVLYSLNRNWDIWAVVTMIWSIYLFEKGKTRQSALVLAVSIATKFFPLVLLLPIAIQYFREKQLKKFAEYFGITLAAWTVINLPFALINFRGWSYFYEFNYKRGLGSASFYEIVGKLGSKYSFTNVSFYALNLLIFGLVTAYFLFSKNPVPLSEAAFFTMFAFILFNKQYSMQYIIWLTALAAMALSRLNKRHQNIALISFIAWQIFDLLFQYAFFQNILTNTYASTTTPVSPAISNDTYGVIGGIRYMLAVTFFVILGYFLYSEKKAAAAPKES